jgi:hypothetical protein
MILATDPRRQVYFCPNMGSIEGRKPSCPVKVWCFDVSYEKGFLTLVIGQCGTMQDLQAKSDYACDNAKAVTSTVRGTFTV